MGHRVKGLSNISVYSHPSLYHGRHIKMRCDSGVINAHCFCHFVYTINANNSVVYNDCLAINNIFNDSIDTGLVGSSLLGIAFLSC